MANSRHDVWTQFAATALNGALLGSSVIPGGWSFSDYQRMIAHTASTYADMMMAEWDKRWPNGE